MVEKRDKTTTEGRGLGHSWADDNVARGDPDVDFIKRRPKFPFGDNPRGREIDFTDTTGDEAYASNKTYAPCAASLYETSKLVDSKEPSS